MSVRKYVVYFHGEETTMHILAGHDVLCFIFYLYFSIAYIDDTDASLTYVCQTGYRQPSPTANIRIHTLECCLEKKCSAIFNHVKWGTSTTHLQKDFVAFVSPAYSLKIIMQNWVSSERTGLYFCLRSLCEIHIAPKKSYIECNS